MSKARQAGYAYTLASFTFLVGAVLIGYRMPYPNSLIGISFNVVCALIHGFIARSWFTIQKDKAQ